MDNTDRDRGRRSSMKVKEVMMGTPYYCQLETNLGSATELMWNANCGFLPVEASDGKVVGVITDRDICIALGTRTRLPGDVVVGDVISGNFIPARPMMRSIWPCKPSKKEEYAGFR
jgi:CBS domain-containing protein